jgi:hypothetical protein
MARKFFHSLCRCTKLSDRVFEWKRGISLALSSMLLLPLAVAFLQPGCAKDIKNLELGAPLDTPGNTQLPETPRADAAMGGLSAPGADAIMTPDMLLVSPNNADNQAPRPLQAYVGVSLKIDIDRSDIELDRLHGIMISVTNETNRSLVVNGEKAEALIDGKSTPVASISTVQLTVVPPRNGKALEDTLTKIIPAAVTIGAVPTIRDFKNNRKPVVERYGADELRRRVEASRFGRRILWPNEKTTGVLYFDTQDDLGNASVQIPVSTLFDKPDKSVLIAAPKSAK